MLKATNSIDKFDRPEFNFQSLKTNLKSLESQFQQTERLACKYHNQSDFVQIIRVADSETMFLEKTLMPDQQVQFVAGCHTLLEIHESSLFNYVHTDTIPCINLVIESYKF
jgi:hypothetical protein